MAATGRQAGNVEHMRPLKLGILASQSRIGDVGPASEAVASGTAFLMPVSRTTCHAVHNP